MPGEALDPWYVAIGGGIVTTLLGTVGKLWSELGKERLARMTEVDGLRAELSESHRRVVELQREANDRGDEHQREHLRDLRRIAGLTPSAPPPRGDVWPPAIIRAELPRGKPPPRRSS